MFEDYLKRTDAGLNDAQRALISFDAAEYSNNSKNLYENTRQIYDNIFSGEDQTYCGVEIHQDIGSLAMGYGLITGKETLSIERAIASNAHISQKILERRDMLKHCFGLIPKAKKIYEILGKQGIEDWKRSYYLDENTLSCIDI